MIYKSIGIIRTIFYMKRSIDIGRFAPHPSSLAIRIKQTIIQMLRSSYFYYENGIKHLQTFNRHHEWIF